MPTDPSVLPWFAEFERELIRERDVANPSTAGQAVTLTATVTSAAGVPAGTVTFLDGATVLGTGTLVNGSASLTTSALATGSHPLTASYGGAANFAASTSAVVTQVVNPAAAGKASSSITLTASPTTIRRNKFVTFTATVKAVPPATGTPTGTVTIMDGTTAIATVRVNAAGVDTFATRNLAIATHSMTAVYNGDATFLGSTSAVVIVTITP